jgi:hypothetical protein
MRKLQISETKDYFSDEHGDSALDISPIHPKNADGHYDFYHINNVYFDRAEQMVRMAGSAASPAENGSRIPPSPPPKTVPA